MPMHAAAAPRPRRDRHGHDPRRQCRLLSVKFQVFAVEGRRDATAADQGPDGWHRQSGRACARAARTAIRWPTAPIRSRRLHDVPAALAIAGAWLRDELRINPIAVGHRVVHGGPDHDRPVLIDHGVVARARALRLACAAASAAQSGADPLASDQSSRSSAGRLLRYRVSSRLMTRSRTITRSRSSFTPKASVVTAFTVSRTNTREAAAEDRTRNRKGARDRRASRQRRLHVRDEGRQAASRAPWGLPRSTGFRWGRGRARSTLASCSI